MAIQKIDQESCIGCGICQRSCPMDVIRIDPDTRKAYPKYPQDCIICCICIAECPTDSIEMNLERKIGFPAGW